MNRKTVQEAIDEAERFVRAAKELLDSPVRAYDPDAKRDVNRKWTYSTDNPKASGACRRASMDLTRALAEMRKP